MVHALSFPTEIARAWAAGALLLLAAVALWQFLALRTRVAVPRALALAVLRAAALALVLVLLAGPRRVLRSVSRESRPVAVLVDTSQSMGLRGGLEGTRLDRVRSFLGSEDFKALAGEFPPRFMAFAAAAAPVPPDGLGALRADGPRTDIAGAVSAAGGAGA
ncbi:MAG TPA: hypothetical protein VI078_04080, partial [bacterium]